MDEAEARTRLASLEGWRLDGGQITREFTFKVFPDAIAFLVRLAFAAEAADQVGAREEVAA